MSASQWIGVAALCLLVLAIAFSGDGEHIFAALVVGTLGFVAGALLV